MADTPRPINRIVIHCADTPNGRPHNAADIERWHNDRGWSGIGYHFVVCLDGTVENGRPLERPGAHVKDHNHDSIGICLIGRDKFTTAQWDALARLVAELQARFGVPGDQVLGHRDLDGHKTCPNFSVWHWVACHMVAHPNHVLELPA